MTVRGITTAQPGGRDEGAGEKKFACSPSQVLCAAIGLQKADQAAVTAAQTISPRAFSSALRASFTSTFLAGANLILPAAASNPLAALR